jgi:hypothetical protein
MSDVRRLLKHELVETGKAVSRVVNVWCGREVVTTAEVSCRVCGESWVGYGFVIEGCRGAAAD